MTTTTNSMEEVNLLKQVQEKIRKERAEFDQTVEQTRSVFEYREQAIETAINGLEVAFGQEIDFGPAPQSHVGPVLSISEKNLKAVDDYLARRANARQADIVSDLKLNSGTVSVALRKLMDDGRVTRGEKLRGSQTWVHESPIPEDERETLVRPGEAPARGRKRQPSAV